MLILSKSTFDKLICEYEPILVLLYLALVLYSNLYLVKVFQTIIEIDVSIPFCI